MWPCKDCKMRIEKVEKIGNYYWIHMDKICMINLVLRCLTCPQKYFLSRDFLFDYNQEFTLTPEPEAG